MHTPECACHRICVDFRGQCVGVNSLLCHVGHQARQKAPLHMELSHSSISRKFKRMFDCFKLKKIKTAKKKIRATDIDSPLGIPLGGYILRQLCFQVRHTAHLPFSRLI